MLSNVYSTKQTIWEVDLIDIWDCVENLSELSKALVKDVRIEIKIEVC